MTPTYAPRRLLGSMLIIGLLAAATALAQTPLGTAFTYQGHLKDNGVPVTTTSGQLRFTLYDAQTAGNPVGSPIVLTNVNIQDGLFTVTLDFGAAAFGANARWLQVAVYKTGTGWVDLSPRQRVTPTPAALFAQNAAGLAWPFSASCAGGLGINSMLQLDYAGDGAALVVNATGPDAQAIHATTTEFDTSAIYGDVWGDVSTAVVGYANATGPDAYGTGGGFVSKGEHGTGVFAHAQAESGMNYGVYGRTNSPQGYGGYFVGRGYFSGDVGIGTTDPDYPLHVVHNGGATAVAGECIDEGTAGFLGHESAGVFGIGHYGVWGYSTAAGGVAVLGSSSAVSGNSYGVRGETSSTAGAAVSAQALATTGTANGVYATTATAQGSGVYGQNTSHTGDTEGVMGVSMSPTGKGVLGYNSAASGNAYGVYGETESPTGYAGYFVGRGYFSEALGLGVSNPAQALDVAGTVQATGFKLTTGPVAGHVLTCDAAGIGSWQPPAGGESFWEQTGSNIYYDAGDVGIGTASPAAPLDVLGGNWDLGATEGDVRVGNASYRLKIGVATSGGGAGTARIRAQAATGTPKLIFGAGTLDTMTVTSNSVGIGTTVPTTKLDVLGTVKMTGFTLNSSPSAGYVLTCDATGNGTWQAPTGGGGFTLPYEGTLDSGSAGIQITNDGSGAGLYGIGGNYGVRGTGDSNGVQGFSSSGNGVNGYSNSGVGVKAQSNGTTVDHPALHASSINANGISIFSTCASTDANTVIANTGTGDLIKGFSGTGGGDLVFRVENNGKTHVSVLQIEGGSDLSEQFDVQPATAQDVAADPQPGMVVCIDPANPGKLVPSTRAYDRTVAGVISGAGGVQPGMMMGQRDTLADGQHPVALTGRVYVWADASPGPIQPGDLLTTASRAGHAMKVADYEQAHGAVLGKAMTPLSDGQGLVLVLVSLQ